MMMRAIEISDGALKPCMRPLPPVHGDDVRIKVMAAGLNRADIFQVAGNYPPPPGSSDLPGMEVAGIIDEVGDQATAFHPGDRVCALLTGGGYAEYAVAPVDQVLALPEHFTFIQGAALPETFFTCWLNLFDKGALKAGDSLLVHGGASGIGTTAIMLATAFHIDVIATAGSQQKCDFCLELGAKAVINYYTEDVVARIKDITKGEGVTMVLDILGGDYLAKNLACLKRNGRIVTISLLRGNEATIPLGALLMKNLTIMGSTLRSQPPAVKAQIARDLQKHVWPLLTSGSITPVIDKTFLLEEAASAHDYMKSNQHKGKIILTV